MCEYICENHSDFHIFVKECKYLIHQIESINPITYPNKYERQYTKMGIVTKILKYVNSNLDKIMRKYGKEKPKLHKFCNVVYLKGVEFVGLLSNKYYAQAKNKKDADLREECLNISNTIKKRFRKYKNIDKFMTPNEEINPQIIDYAIIMKNYEKIREESPFKELFKPDEPINSQENNVNNTLVNYITYGYPFPYTVVIIYCIIIIYLSLI
jgi:hypothetical protein